MKLTTFFVALSVAATSVTAAPSNTTTASLVERAKANAINIGNNGVDVVAWVHGDSKCTAAIVGASGSNFCHRPFGLRIGGGFTVEGCGGPLWINQNGKFWGNCGAFSEGNHDCSVTTQYHCN